MYFRYWAVGLTQKKIPSWNEKHENPRKIDEIFFFFFQIDEILYLFRRSLFGTNIVKSCCFWGFSQVQTYTTEISYFLSLRGPLV